MIDLSHALTPDITVFPGTEKPHFEKIDIEGYRELRITMFTHTGTHIDAPWHILREGKSLDEFPADKFVGAGLKINCKQLAGQAITYDFLEFYHDKINIVDFVLFNTGWSAKWKTDAYFSNFPVLDADAAELLSEFDLKGVGFDCISIDPVRDMTLPNHHIVLKKDFIIIENLTNLDSLPEEGFTFQCLPLKIEKADGSPVRAIAMLNG